MSRSCLVLLILAFSLGRLAAWDAGGHELIATMAYTQLNARARAAVDRLAGEIPQSGRPYDAITMACWMDDLRTTNPEMPNHGLFLTWHYIDLGAEDGDPLPSFEPGTDNEFHGNVVQGLKRAIVVLKGGTDPYIPTQALACAMVMHLVGDIHQPLHAAAHYFISYHRLQNDAGGNRENVENGPLEERLFSLHMFWDSAWRASLDTEGRILLDERYREKRFHRPEEVQALARELLRHPPPAEKNLQPNVDQWALESNRRARDFVYREITEAENRKYCRLSSAYVTRANELARSQLALAAARLAVLLNRTLGASLPGPVPPAYPAGPASGGVAY